MPGETLWDTYSSHWLEALKDLKSTNHLSDVSILCEDKTRFEAHKLVLSSCSEELKNIVELLPAVSSVLYFHDISGNVMNSLLEFIYQGRTVSRQEDFKDFIDLANKFGLKGLNNTVTNPLLDQEKDNSVSILNEFEELVSDESFLEETETQEEALLQCTLCKYKATQQGHLKNHVKKVHERITDKCEECDKEFADRSNLRRHIRVAHENVRYKCNQCEKEFTERRNLYNHVRSLHEGIKDRK